MPRMIEFERRSILFAWTFDLHDELSAISFHLSCHIHSNIDVNKSWSTRMGGVASAESRIAPHFIFVLFNILKILIGPLIFHFSKLLRRRNCVCS